MNYKNIIISIIGVIILIALGAGLGFYVMPKLGEERIDDTNKEVITKDFAQEEVQPLPPTKEEAEVAPATFVVVKGVVKNAISEEPLEGVEVTVGDKKVKTDKQGNFLEEIEVKGGDINVRYSLSGYCAEDEAISSTEGFMGGISDKVVSLMPDGRVVYLKSISDGRGQIVKSTYCNGVPEIITNDLAYVGSLSPRFRKFIYSTVNEHDNNLYIKMIDVRTPADIKIVANYSPDFSANSVSAIKWSTDGGRVAWSMDGPLGDIVYYLNILDGGIYTVPNPYKANTNTFEEVDSFYISPNSEFIGIIGREEGQSILVLHDIQKGAPIMNVAEASLFDGVFFDALNNFYYQVHNALWYNNKDIWIKYHTRTGYQDVYANKPAFWDKLKESELSVDKAKILYFCDNYRDSLCVASSDGSGEKKILSAGKAAVSDIWKFFWSPDGSHIFFAARSNNSGKHNLWMLSSSGKWGPKDLGETQ